MSGSIHQARFGSRSFISSKSNLMSSSRKDLASDSMRFQKPLAQVRGMVYITLYYMYDYLKDQRYTVVYTKKTTVCPLCCGCGIWQLWQLYSRV